MRVVTSITSLVFLLSACSRESAEPVAQGIAIDDDDIAGVVTSSAGPEAGVWVIAETDEFGMLQAGDW